LLIVLCIIIHVSIFIQYSVTQQQRHKKNATNQPRHYKNAWQSVFIWGFK